MAPWAQDPLEAASAVCGAAPCASRLEMLGRWRANTHGDHALALRGVTLVTASRRFVRLMLLPIDSYFS